VNPEEELELLEQLMQELLAGIQDALQSGEVLSDEFQGALAQELETTTQRIDQLREIISEQEPEEPLGNGQENEPEEPPGNGGGQIGAPPSPDAQLLWILAGQQEQAFISYLRTYPTQATRDLLNNPHELSRVIDFLSQMMPQGEQPTVDGIQHADLNSSNIWGTAYDEKTGKLKVRFQGGAEYEYDGVPANIYRAFSHGNASATTRGQNQYGRWWPNKNPSLGAAMNQYIKAGRFPYRRLR
jgi:hypothetical protein